MDLPFALEICAHCWRCARWRGSDGRAHERSRCSSASRSLRLSPLGIGLKLFTIIAVAAGTGVLMRWLVGAAAIRRRRQELDGVNILLSFVFVAAVMQHVLARAADAPLQMLAMLAGAAGVFLVILSVTTILFAAAGRDRALALGCMASQRNMGLMLAATGGVLPELTLVYFAAGQLPIYLSPLLLQSLPLTRSSAAIPPLREESPRAR